MPKTKKDAKTAAKDAAKKFKKGTVHLVLLCDESGSMGGNVEPVVSGVNEFVDSFRDADCKVTISMFDATPGEPRCRVKCAGKPVKKVKALTAADYRPRGGTPLNDAILETVGATENAVGKDERVFMVILTDGMENSSEATSEAVAEVLGKREKKGWGILYLGANVNAQQAAGAIGLSKPGSFLAFRSSRRGTTSALRSATGFAQNYYGAESKAAYDASAAQVSALAGGKVDEDADDITKS